jgi:DNA-binding winged helix-turn-helix (wHTH) protein
LNLRLPPQEPAAGVDLAREPRFRLRRTEVRPATLELVRDEASVTLERKVMQALVVLARHAGEVTSREELIEQVWSGRFIGEDAIHRVIAKLRHAAETHCGRDFALETIPRVGYRLVLGDAPAAATPGRRARGSRPSAKAWAGVAAGVAVALGGLGALRWWPAPADQPPSVRLLALRAL